MSQKERKLNIILIAIIGVIVLALIVTLIVSYKKPLPNEALVVTGLGLKESRIVTGRGIFVIPIFQGCDTLDLSAFNIEVSVRNANTATQVPLNVKGNASLNIGTSETLARSAAQKLLGKTDDERDTILGDIIRGSVRGILGNMNPEDVPNKKAIFQENVKSDVEQDLAEFGIEVRSIQIVDVSDEQGFIESLYAEDVANRKAEALIKKAEADRRSREAVAQQDQQAKAVEQEAQRNIADQEKQTAVRQAEFKSEQDKAKGIADQAYKLSTAEASKKVIETEGQANKIKAEQEAIVSEKQVQVARNEFNASVIAKTDADAQAQVITAEANAKTIKTNAEADAEQIRMTGQAEADKIASVGQANAQAQSQMAKALAEGGTMVLKQALIEKLPELAQAYADAIGSIDNMTVFDGSKAVGGMVDNGLAQMFQGIQSATGLDLKKIVEQRGEGRFTLASADDDTEVAKEVADKVTKVVPEVLTPNK